MTNPQIIESKRDNSVNFIFPTEVGVFEARFVRRCNDYIVVYLSSQSGCQQGCRMCFLTASKQTQLVNATLNEIEEQAAYVLGWYDNYHNQQPAKKVHFNFMARGEPLENPTVHYQSHILFSRLAKLASSRELLARFLVSTILPKDLVEYSLEEMFPVIQPEIYYSLYSVDETFRKKWLPKAMPAHEGLVLLKAWQDHSAKIPKIHYAFIENENDGFYDVLNICEIIQKLCLRVDINIVRYNSFSSKHGSEAPVSTINSRVQLFKKCLPDATVQIVPRVGYDVNASCGMFV